MDKALLLEVFGYVGTVLVVVSMLMSSLVKLRVINTIGSVISGSYALIIGSYPMVLMNGSIILINLYNLHKLLRTKQQYELVDGNADESFINYVLNHYKEDIASFFPEFNVNNKNYDTAYIICCDTTPAGVMLGKMQENGVLEVVLDYSTPAYRDCSVGTYLYSKLPSKGVKKVLFSGKTQNHEAYLQKMGFAEKNGIYVKEW